jgi:diadenosine tetraphosphatase ApaH/serine/threonine PP2A family protein phosphatase
VRTLIVSDVHGNLVALDAVLRSAASDGPFDAVWCLGDTVGYGPQPAECIARLRELGAAWVAGNHERAATGAISTEYFNPDAAAAAHWTREHLSVEDQALLDALPEVATQGDFTLVHGSLRDPIWEYLYDEEVALAHLGLQETPFGLVGHTHVPMAAYQHPDWEQRCELYQLKNDDAVRLSERGKMVLNPGSVGQPRDHDPRASCAIYDTEAGVVVLRRVEYDINSTQKLMTDAGLPAWLIKRLSQGR